MNLQIGVHLSAPGGAVQERYHPSWRPQEIVVLILVHGLGLYYLDN